MTRPGSGTGTSTTDFGCRTMSSVTSRPFGSVTRSRSTEHTLPLKTCSLLATVCCCLHHRSYRTETRPPTTRNASHRQTEFRPQTTWNLSHRPHRPHRRRRGLDPVGGHLPKGEYDV